MPLRLCFHNKGFIYIKGSLHTDTFEVLLSQVDMDNFDDETGEGRPHAMDTEKPEMYKSIEDDEQSEMDDAKNWKAYSNR